VLRASEAETGVLQPSVYSLLKMFAYDEPKHQLEMHKYAGLFSSSDYTP
jgi:hypothetical protein